jgi:large subunit ribosomal protein L13
MKTYSAKPDEVVRKWYVIDAAEAPVGRIATVAATLLTGKGKPMFTRHIDVGDYVIIVNADKLVMTGNKATGKTYYRHSQYPGGLTETTLAEQMVKDSTAVFAHAIRGMLPVNKLRPARLERLKIYAGTEHKHDPQSPEKFSVKEGK